MTSAAAIRKRVQERRLEKLLKSSPSGGAPGERGPPGADGARGPAGADGATGATGLPGVGFMPMVPAAGLFIANGSGALALGTQAQVANRTVIAPFIPSLTVTVDQLGVSISTLIASALFKVVIYAADANGRPSTILRETGTIDAGSTGTKFAGITSLTLSAGTRYWIGIRSSSTSTLRTLGLTSSPLLTYTNAATPVAQGALIKTETFASAATDWSYASGQHSNALVPLVLMRVA